MAAKKKVEVNIEEVKEVKALKGVVLKPLNLRKEPSVNAEKLCVMGVDEVIEVLPCDKDGWYAVKFMEVSGFAMSQFIKVKK